MGTTKTPSGARSPRLFLLAPLLVYGLSYAYLAYYHGKLWLLTTIIHEGGKLDLVGTLFYAPHFIGHLPVITVVALFFAGYWLLLVGDSLQVRLKSIVWALLVLLIASFMLGWVFFGGREMQDFLLQRRQSESVYGEGGSWNLHLPSTLLLPLLIPTFVLGSSRLLQRRRRSERRGVRHLLLGAGLTVLMTVLVNEDSLQTVRFIWDSPRYLAHSVRELATFPVTYFPLAVFFLMSRTRTAGAKEEPTESGQSPFFRAALGGLIVFGLGVLYQSWKALGAGIPELAQKPAFARPDGLGIPYLLASHYFEHFLDSWFFALLCLLLCRLATPSRP